MKLKRNKYWIMCLYCGLVLTMAITTPVISHAQVRYLVNLAQIEGTDVTPDNMFNFTIQQTAGSSNVLIKGTLRYRNSPLFVNYSFRANLKMGTNAFSFGTVRPQWQFSSPDLQDLFLNQKTLPAGTYEYCVHVLPDGSAGEVPQDDFEECVYHQNDESFLIDLVEPDDKAKLKEYNPVFSWMANHSTAPMLTYRIRIADIKHGQNAVNAVNRNPPVFTESGLLTNTIVYPQFAKPLVKKQRYAWTVDAYYKSLLLGGSETWEFMIIDDTTAAQIPVTRSYIDIRLEKGTSKIYAAGELKLKYVLEDLRKDSLQLEIYSGQEILEPTPKMEAVRYGDNRFVLNLQDKMSLKHMREYMLVVTSKSGKYRIPFTYVNPQY